MTHTNDIQASVLGMIMTDTECQKKYNTTLKPEYFTGDYKLIFDLIHDISSNDKHPDMVTVAMEAKKRENQRLIKPITELVNSFTGSAEFEQHCLILHQEYIRIRLPQLMANSVYQLANLTQDPVETIDQLVNSLNSLTNVEWAKSTIEPANEVFKSTVSQLEAVVNQYRKGIVSGLTFGVKDFDHNTGGAQPTDLIIIAARPGMGKTAFAQYMCRTIAKKNKPVAFFGLEMLNYQLALRMISSEAKSPVNSLQMRTGNISDHQLATMVQAAYTLQELPIYFSDQTFDIDDICRQMRILKTENNIQAAFIDYLQLIRTKAKTGNREQEVASITRQIKQLAKELQIPIYLLAQLSREVERRPDKRPQLSDLRESGAIEQDADMVVFLLRPGYYNMEDENGAPIDYRETTAIIAKNRHGFVGDIEMQSDDNLTAYWSKELNKPQEFSQQIRDFTMPQSEEFDF